MSSTEAAASRARAATSSSRPKKPALIGLPRSGMGIVAHVLEPIDGSGVQAELRGTPRRTCPWRASRRSGRRRRRPSEAIVSTRTPWACAGLHELVAGLEHRRVVASRRRAAPARAVARMPRRRTGRRTRRPGPSPRGRAAGARRRRREPCGRWPGGSTPRSAAPARAASTVPPHISGLESAMPMARILAGFTARSRCGPHVTATSSSASATTFGSVCGPRWTRSSRPSTTTAMASWSPVWVGSRVV